MNRRLLFEICEERRMLANTFTVNVDYDDAGPFNLTDNIVTLREAVFRANQIDDLDTILFDSSLDGQTITLGIDDQGNNLNLGSGGELVITEAVTIDALGQNITIDASGNDNDVNVDDGGGSRVFSIMGFEEEEVVLQGLTITGGDVDGNGGGILLDNLGLAPNLTLNQVVLDSNAASERGGGLYSAAIVASDLTITNSTVSNNLARTQGGGIYSSSTSSNTSIVDSSITGNRIESLTDNIAEGGGIYHLATQGNDNFLLSGSTVANNHALNSQGMGGGLFLCVKASGGTTALISGILNSTISGNSAAAQGGGVFAAINAETFSNGTVSTDINNTTITDNWSPDGGGLYSDPDPGFQRVMTTLNNTIVSGNYDSAAKTIANNIAGAIEATSAYNLIGTGTATNPTGSGNVFNDNPGLGALADNGGFMLPDGSTILTHAPLSTSPAVDAGDPSILFDANEFDQRGTGFARVVDGGTGNARIDIGAVEFQAVADTTPPTITDVIFSNTTSGLSNSMDERDGSGLQLAPLTVAMPDKIEIIFSETIDPASVSNSSLTLIGLTTGDQPTINNVTPNGDSVSWDVTGWNVADVYLLSLDDSVVDLSSNANALDGEWTNPLYVAGTSNSGVSTFGTMGDGQAGGDFHFAVTYVPGDLNESSPVDGLDLGILLGAWRPVVPGEEIYGDPADLNVDGFVDGLDLGILLGFWGIGFDYLPYADFNDNHYVDSNDLLLIADNIGLQNATYTDGDLNGDDVVDATDLAIAQMQELLYINLGIELDWVDNS